MRFNLISTTRLSLISTIRFSLISTIKQLNSISTIRLSSISTIRLSPISTIRQISSISTIRQLSPISTIRLNSISTIKFSSISMIKLSSISMIRLSSISMIRLSLISTTQFSLILILRICWFISTVMIRFKSVYCMWSLLLNDDTSPWSSYLLNDLYVESLGHVTTLTHLVVIPDYTLRPLKKVINPSHLVVSHCLVSFNSDFLLIQPMPHRTWIVVLMNCASFLYSLFRGANLRPGSMIARLINCLISCLLDCPPDWLTAVGEAVRRSDEGGEIDDSSDRSTESVIDDSTEGLTDDSTDDSSDDSSDDSFDDSSDDSFDDSSDDSTRDSSDDSTEDLSDGSSSGLSGDPTGGLRFFVAEGSTDDLRFFVAKGSIGDLRFFVAEGSIGDLRFFVARDLNDRSTDDSLFDCSSNCLSSCSSNWLTEMNGSLYCEMRSNWLYNCLLNTDGNLDDWKKFENRDEVDCLFDENDETERSEIDDERLRPKFVFKWILMMMKMKFSSNKHLNISSSIHLRGFFFWRVLYRAFSMMIFSSLDIHTSRLLKVSRNRRKRVCKTSDLKFFSVHSSKSSWYCSHNSLFMRLSCSHSLIFVSTHFFQSWISFIPPFNSGCEAILQGFSGLRGSGMLWLRSSFCKGSRACDDREIALAAEQFCKNLIACEIVCRVNLPWLRDGTNLVGWDSKEEIAESNSLSGCWQQK